MTQDARLPTPGSPPPYARASSPGSRSLVALMLLSVAAVVLLALWDARRESAAALDDFAQEQRALAESVASEVGTRLAESRAAGAPATGAPDPAKLLEGVDRVERLEEAKLLVQAPNDPRLHGADGRPVDSEPIQRALLAGQT